jgi:uncharacterized protein
MTIRNYSEDEFQEVLYGHLSPSEPISNVQLLKGRERTLRQIRQALLSPGRHVFIYGDRGVGKTSLAQTAATLYQSSDAHPITLSCSAPFYQLVRDLIARCNAPTGAAGAVSPRRTKVKVGFPLLGGEREYEHAGGAAPELHSINEAILALRPALERHSKTPVVIFDEFDLISDDSDKRLFADFIKQVSDQRIPVKLIFTGIGRSITDLLTVHNSAVRYLENIPLERLDYSARIEIISSCADALGVDVGRDTTIRISLVSDGFPHYVHLIGEKLFWVLFNKDEIVDRAMATDYIRAINDAVESIQAFLQDAYNRATRKYTDDYEEILWAAADAPQLERSSSQIFQSYKRILRSLPKERWRRDEKSIAARWFSGDKDEEELRKRFNGRINRLKTAAHGAILIGTRAGWYEYRENIVRGYVRLRAERTGVPLEVDHPLLGSRFRDAR